MNANVTPLLTLLLLVQPAFAQSAEPNLESMTVYGTRTADSVHDTPATVTIIGRQDLNRYDAPGANLGTILGKVLPGLGAPTESVSNFGQSLRGRDVLILIDGIPQLENRQVSRQLGLVKVESVERVEVIAGANAIYGSGAPGGIINIITKAYSQSPLQLESFVGTSVASNPLASASQSFNIQETVSGTSGDFQYLASLGAEKRGNSFDADGNLIGPEPAQTSRSDTNSYDALVKLAYKISTDRTLESSISAFQEQQDTDYVTLINPYRAETGLELSDQPGSKRLQLALTYADKNFLGQSLSLQAYYRQREMSFFPFELTQPVTLVNQSLSTAEIVGLKTILQSKLSPSTTLAWGLDLEDEKGVQKAHSYDYARFKTSGGKIYDGKSSDYDYGPSIHTQKAALFTQLKSQVTDTLLSKFGLRYERITQKINDFTPPLETAIASNWQSLYTGIGRLESAGRVPAGTTSTLPTTYTPYNFEGDTLAYDEWALNFALGYDLTPKQLLFFNYSQGYDLADTARLLRDAVSSNSLLPRLGPIFRLSIDSSTVSDLEIEAIKTTSYEIGWRGAFAALFGNAALFYNQSDKIYQFNRDFTVDLLDREKRVYGIEASLGWHATDTMTLGLSHTQSKGESKRLDNSGWTALSGMDMAPPKTSATLDYTVTSALTGSLQALHVAPYNKADDFDVHEYLTVDTHMNYALSDTSDIKVGISNLLNRDYQTVFHQWAEATYGAASGAPAAGRTVSLMYRQIL